jgi:tetratricopeptide (TPR) repeat protein
MSGKRVWAAACVLFLASVALAQAPKDPKKDVPPNADEQKAREAFLANKLDEALKLLQAAAKANPALGPPKVVVSRWCVETGQGEQARILLEEAAKEDPAHPEVLLTNGSFALREGRVTDTILSCEAALKAVAATPRWDAEARKRYQREAHLGLATAYEMRGDHATAKGHLAALLEADPKNARLRQRLAQANFVLNRPDDAYADLQTAFKDDLTLDPPELTMAALWGGRQDFAKADEWFAKAVAAHANSAKVHRALTGYLLARGRFDTAKSHLAAAQKIEPAARETKNLAGLFARYTKDYATATALFEELVKDYPSDSFATANLALVLAEAGDTNGRRRAVELAENHAKQNPRQPEARAIYAYALLKAGRTADAEKYARSAIGLGPLSLDGAYFLGRVFADRGSNEEAHRVVKAACDSKDGFVYRKEAEALLAELDKKLPPPKK